MNTPRSTQRKDRQLTFTENDCEELFEDHFQPGETLHDRTDLYHESSNSEDEGGDLTFAGSSPQNCLGDSEDRRELSVNSEWGILLQKRQVMLLQQHDAIKEQNIKFGQRLDTIEEVIITVYGSTEHHQRNSRVPKGLTVSFIGRVASRTLILCLITKYFPYCI